VEARIPRTHEPYPPDDYGDEINSHLLVRSSLPPVDDFGIEMFPADAWQKMRDGAWGVRSLPSPA
jgi:hypothetical protein